MEPTVNVNEVSRISTGTKVKGEISSSNDIRIDGTFEGKIYSKGRVVVGEKALIKGDIICSNVDFWGTMEGNFYVKDTLSLKSSSKVKGDLHIKRLQPVEIVLHGGLRRIKARPFIVRGRQAGGGRRFLRRARRLPACGLLVADRPGGGAEQGKSENKGGKAFHAKTSIRSNDTGGPHGSAREKLTSSCPEP